MEDKYKPHTNIFTIASDIKNFLLAGYQSLPFTIAGTLLILGLYTANYSMLFFLLGFLGIVPFATVFINMLVDFIPIEQKDAPWLFSPQSDICNLLIVPTQGAKPFKTFVSAWTTMMAFFFAYIGTNAMSLHQRPVEYPSKADTATKVAADAKAALRRTQTSLGLVVIVILAVAFFTIRIFVSGCDTVLGSAVGLILFGTLGWAWYVLLSIEGNDRLADLFGIANRLMTQTALANAPYACLTQS